VTGGIDDGVMLAARLFLAALYLIFGRRKLTDFSGTVSQMAGSPSMACAGRGHGDLHGIRRRPALSAFLMARKDRRRARHHNSKQQ